MIHVSLVTSNLSVVCGVRRARDSVEFPRDRLSRLFLLVTILSCLPPEDGNNQACAEVPDVPATGLILEAVVAGRHGAEDVKLPGNPWWGS